ncbi:MAG: SelB C-terminal domain-containing protein, partial [Pseudomonadota bacterium]|nr:SelB C-terminal domain-containing protein [Pseudomonadota bacterium]
NRVFLPRTIEALADIAAELAAACEERAFTAAEFNRQSGIGRNLTIQVLEYLDGAGVTRRLGELRCLAREA